MMSHTILRPFAALVGILCSLLLHSCGETTGPPGAEFPVSHAVAFTTNVSDIRAAVRHGDTWSDMAIDSTAVPEMAVLLLKDSADRLSNLGLDLILLSDDEWAYDFGSSPMTGRYVWEDRRFIFASPNPDDGPMYGYGDAAGFAVPMVGFYTETATTNTIGFVYYSRENAPYELLEPAGFRNDGSDTIYYRSWSLAYRPRE